MSAAATVIRRGVRWSLDLNEGIDLAIWLTGYFEASTVKAYRRILKPGATVLDVGANIGAHTLHLAVAVGNRGRVIAFEPTAHAFNRLCENVALNAYLAGRIQSYQIMLVGTRGASMPEEVIASWPILPFSELDPLAFGMPRSTVGATPKTLDDALKEMEVERVDFVKLDVDGNEIDVLQGAPKMLADHRPTIFLEVAPSHLDAIGRRVENVLQLLESYRYDVTTLDQHHRVTPDLLERLRKNKASINAVAAPNPQ